MVRVHFAGDLHGAQRPETELMGDFRLDPMPLPFLATDRHLRLLGDEAVQLIDVRLQESQQKYGEKPPTSKPHFILIF